MTKSTSWRLVRTEWAVLLITASYPIASSAWHASRDRRSIRLRHFAGSGGGAQALAAFALRALAIGALAIGAVAIGALAIGSARIRRIEIDELVVRRLRVTEDLQLPPSAQSIPED
jgi:hypothetical protein